MKVVCTSPLPIDLAAQLSPADVVVPEQWTDVARCDLSDADALVCLLLDRIDAKTLARAPKLRIVANCAVGYDNVDVAACTARGIAVTNTPDVLTEATAEFTWALILAVARRLPEAATMVRSGQWPGWRLDQLLGVGLAGKTLGIVGMGRIGSAVARRAEAFAMRVIHSDPRGGVPLDELFATADVISLHCPLTPETRHLVDARRLALVKPTTIIINTARGGIVDESAVLEALARGQMFGAGLDVFEGEPKLDARLRADPRLVLAPHLGSATTEARTSMAQLCANAVKAVFAGTRPTHLVNPEVVIHA